MEDQINQYFTLNLLNEQKLHKYSNNIIDRQGIFSNPLFTTISLDTYANIFSDTIEAASNTINSTEGGIGIKNIDNISLREAISIYCGTNVSHKINNILNALTPKKHDLEKTAIAAQNQKILLDSILGTLNSLDRNIVTVSTLTDDMKKDFIHKMDEVVKTMLKDKETTLLLQDYSYSGFSIWNQRTNQILKKRNAMDTKELTDEKFKRDYDFLKVLKDSARFNIAVFNLFFKEANSA